MPPSGPPGPPGAPPVGPPSGDFDPTSGGFGAPPKPPRSGPNPALIVGIIVLVIGLIAGGVILATSGDDDEEDGSTTTEQPDDTGGDTTGGDSTDTTGGDTTDTSGGGGGDDCETFEPGDQDVATDFAIEIFCNTPQGVTEADGTCLANAVIDVVGESTVEDADYTPQTIYGSTESTEDTEIATAAYGCTSSEADTALRNESGGYWPDAWNPTS